MTGNKEDKARAKGRDLRANREEAENRPTQERGKQADELRGQQAAEEELREKQEEERTNLADDDKDKEKETKPTAHPQNNRR